jgi:phytanoyl-CoA hydroxylase
MNSDLQDNGYTILQRVFGDAELAPIRALTDRIVAYAEKGLVDPFKPYYVRHRSDQGVLYDLIQRHPEFDSLARNNTILDALEAVLGPDIFLYENSLVYKPPGKRNAVPWHQDFINRPNEPTKYIAWIALDDATIANGALKVIPRSHRQGFLPWHRVEGETHHTRVNRECVDDSTATYAELKAGDVLIFHQLLLHSSDEIDVPQPRRAYRISYQGFDQIYTPRGTPLVVRGGSPESLAARYPQIYNPQAETNGAGRGGLVRRIIHSVGYRLTRL